MPMPNRNLQGDYRYAYQGQEVDPETGKEAFELRLWDNRIGRWLTTDPYGQYNSPYLGMANNPISAIDPDGGFSWLGAQWFKLWHGGEISEVEHSSGNGSYYKVTGFGSEGSSIAVGRGGVLRAENGPRNLAGAGGLSLFDTNSTADGIPDVYIEANAAVIQGTFKADVRLLGTKVGLGGSLPTAAPIYDLGFKADTSNRQNMFKWNQPVNGSSGDAFGIGAAYGVGADFKFDNSTGSLKEVTYSALVSELTNEYHISGIHKSKISRSKLGINIGATASFLVGLEANFKIGIIIPGADGNKM